MEEVIHPGLLSGKHNARQSLSRNHRAHPHDERVKFGYDVSQIFFGGTARYLASFGDQTQLELDVCLTLADVNPR
jgi:hypothetical protein